MSFQIEALILNVLSQAIKKAILKSLKDIPVVNFLDRGALTLSGFTKFGSLNAIPMPKLTSDDDNR